MTYFTVYYGNNESMMFNAECTTGSLVSRMLEVMLPHTNGYTRLELVPLNFVLEHFKPAGGGSVTSVLTTRGGQQQDAFNETAYTANNTQSATGKSAPFTGAIPFAGLATRPFESCADGLLNSAATHTATGGSQQSASAHGNSASAGAAGGTSSVGGGGHTAPSSSLQNSYVLLGCRHHRQQHRPLNTCGLVMGFPTNSLTTTTPITGSKGTTPTQRKACNSDVVAATQQAEMLHRARLIAAAPIVTSFGARGVMPSTGAGRVQMPHTPTTNTAVEPATLQMYSNGISLSDVTTAPWRKAFSQYLTTSLIAPATEGTPSPGGGSGRLGSPAVRERNSSPPLETPLSATNRGEENKPVLMPSVATGLFITPTLPVIAYDVLWRGMRGEHIRLQQALNDRVFTDTDTQKKKGKRG